MDNMNNNSGGVQDSNSGQQGSTFNSNSGYNNSANVNYNSGYNSNMNYSNIQNNGYNYNASSNMNYNGMPNNGYNYNMNYNMNQNGRKNKSHLGLGMLLGAIIGVFVMIMLVFMCIGGLAGSGMIKVGANGEIYVQAINYDDSDGIGSAIEEKLNTLDSVLDYFYFNDISDEEAADAIFRAYLNAYGDKYTVYYTPEEYKAMMESTSGKFCGIGAVCQQNEDGTILIVEPYDYAPAYKAGVRAGDCVTKIDGKDVTGMSLDAATTLIKGEKGTKVTLDILRDGQPMTFTVTRDEIDVKTVEYEMLENSIGYIAISQFDEVTTQQFKDAVADLKKQGMKGLVLDVRSNPGGLLNGVVEILDEILPTGLIVYTEDKEGNRREYTGNNSNEINVPIAVLVNGDSASASEIFAGAIQDYGKGEIIGTQTFGKGIVQTIQPMSDGSAIKFTIAKYFTPRGQDIHGKGVTPDQVVELPQDATSDVQLEAAISYLKGQMQ